MNIKDILNNLDDNDKRLWVDHRTNLHRAYLTMLHDALGVASIDETDMAFLDLVDIKLALVFERAGRFRSEVAADSEKADEIEKAIAEKAKSLETLRKPGPLALVDSVAGWGK